MFTWAPYPFIRISGAYILGLIIIRHYPKISILSSNIMTIAIGLWVLGLVAMLCYKYSKRTLITGFLLIIVLIILGMVRMQNVQTNYASIHSMYPIDSIDAYIGTIVDYQKSTDQYNVFKMDVEKLVVKQKLSGCSGKVLLYIKKDSTQADPNSWYGERLLITGTPRRITNYPLLGSFDYQQFMADQGIFYQHRVEGKSIRWLGVKSKNGLWTLTAETNNRVIELFDQYIKHQRERSILKALVIGYKIDLTAETRKQYAAVGAMHILAVSGLHIGIIYMVLSFLLKPLKRHALGQVAFMVLSLVALWSYAFITGLSPSVFRAATMFSIIVIGEAFSKRSNIYNSLAVSALILLIYDPFLLFSVGFQLSYVAVIGIVYLAPKKHE